MADRYVPSDETRTRFAQDGWCLVTDVFSPEEVAAAQAVLHRYYPEGDFEAWPDGDGGWPEFPYRSKSLNHLTLHDHMLDLAEQLLGVDDVRMYLSALTAKYPGQPSGFNQLLHADYPNHTLLVPRADGGYQHLETYIYLSDVSPANGATRFVSLKTTEGVPVERHTLSYELYPEAYDAAIDASGPAGSVVMYRPDTFHCSVDYTTPGAVRHILMASYRPAAAEWGGHQAWPFKGFSMEWWNFVQQAKPRQLLALGFPPPGDPYWTAETLAGVQARYPGLDMTAWRA